MLEVRPRRAGFGSAAGTGSPVWYHAVSIDSLVGMVCAMGENGTARFLAGVKQFNHAQFFDAHETWEALWMEASGADKIFLQGAIQVAAAFHHWTRGNIPGARSLLHAGLEKLGRFPAVYRGIRVDRLREDSRACLDALGGATGPAGRAPAQIEMETGLSTHITP